MTLQALAERLRGHLPSAFLGSAPTPPKMPTKTTPLRAPPPNAPPPLPAHWMATLRCAPRLMGVALMRNSMGASLALLTGVLVLDAVMTDPPRRKRKARQAAAAAAAPPLTPPAPPLA